MEIRLRFLGFSGIGGFLGFSWGLGSSEGSGGAPGGKRGLRSQIFLLSGIPKFKKGWVLGLGAGGS